MTTPRWWNRSLLPWAITPWDQRSTRCPKCWYDMTGVLPNRCPECGSAWAEPGDFWTDGRYRFGPLLVAIACAGATTGLLDGIGDFIEENPERHLRFAAQAMVVNGVAGLSMLVGAAAVALGVYHTRAGRAAKWRLILAFGVLYGALALFGSIVGAML